MDTATIALVGVILLAALLYLSVTVKLRLTWQWEADWEGHRIVVKQRYSPLLREREELIIDGMPVSGTGLSGTPIREDLYGEIRTGGRVHRVHVHVGYADEELEMSCLISVDGTPVGGDVDKRFYT